MCYVHAFMLHLALCQEVHTANVVNGTTSFLCELGFRDYHIPERIEFWGGRGKGGWRKPEQHREKPLEHRQGNASWRSEVSRTVSSSRLWYFKIARDMYCLLLAPKHIKKFSFSICHFSLTCIQNISFPWLFPDLEIFSPDHFLTFRNPDLTGRLRCET